MQYEVIGITLTDILAAFILVGVQGFLGFAAAKLTEEESLDYGRGILLAACLFALMMMDLFGFLFVFVLSVLSFLAGVFMYLLFGKIPARLPDDNGAEDK
jgi:hypothetical protein